MNFFINLNPVIQALIATTFTWGITALGALMVCFFKQMNQRVLDTVLGGGAGVMIAASFWSLLIPALDLSKELGYLEWLFPAIGFLIGGLFVLGADLFVDKVTSLKNIENNSSLKRTALLITAITVHNIPEGMAIGVAFGGVAIGVPGATAISALLLAIGIGLQNFPEGAAVSLPLRREGMGRFKSFMIGQASALVEPIAAVIGVIAVTFMRGILPLLLSFAAGAMICVIIRELIPEAVKENKNLATIGAVVGFLIMMILDVALS